MTILRQLMTKYALEILFLATLTPLVAAYIAQYGFGLEPCILCIYQRIPYALLAGIALIFLLMKKPFQQWVWLLSLLLIVSEVGIALYHVAVEQKIITEGIGCTEAIQADSIEALRAQLLATPAVPCDDPAFFFLGLSMAGWNVIYAAILLVIMVYFKKDYVKETR